MLTTIVHPVLRLALWVFFRDIDVRGRDQVPAGVPLIFVANHPSVMMDPLIIGLNAPGKTPHFPGKGTLFKYPQEQARGHFCDFCNELKEAEAGFRATRLQRLVDAAEKSKVKIRKTVRTMGDGDDQKVTFQEVVEETVLPDPRWDAWLLERKYPEQYSRKHLNTKVTNTEPPPVRQLVIVDPVKLRATEAEASVATGEPLAEG